MNKPSKHKPMQIDANDRGHGHVGEIMNHGMDNHMHRRKLGGVASSPKTAKAVHGTHPVFNTKSHTC
jgi:hypothetical protein